jgi:hypothetical protein
MHHAEALVCHRAAAGVRRDDADMTDTALSPSFADARAVELRLPRAISAKAYTRLVFALMQGVTDVICTFQVRSVRS